MAAAKLPTATLKQNGTYRPSVHGRDEPQVEVAAPIRPDWIRGRDDIRRFNELTGICLDMDIISRADGLGVGLLVHELRQYLTMHERILADGVMITETNGNNISSSKVHPLISARAKTVTNIKGLLSEYGLTPAARSKVVVNESSQQSGTEVGKLLEAIQSANKK